jgi:hypothetical protein
MGARWYDAQLGRWISADTIVPDPANPQSLNRYSYVYNNPLKYVDPSGHVTVDAERAQKLHDYALHLLTIEDLNPMERFEAFMAYAAGLYGDDETDQFMVDVTAVLHGHEYDTEGGYAFYTQRRDFSSKYFLGHDTNWRFFHDANDSPGEGWAEEYKDGSTTQVYHFWFYVASAYFDGGAKAYGGNFLHDGYATPVGETIAPIWNDAVERLGIGEDYLMSTGDIESGVTRADYDLGALGVDLGMRLGTSYLKGPSEVSGWLGDNLSNGENDCSADSWY